MVALASLAALGVLLLRQEQVARLCGGEVPDTHKIMQDLAKAFLIMAATAGLFMLANSRLAVIANTSAAEVTLGKIAKAQARIASLSDGITTGKVALWVSAIVLVTSVCLLALGQVRVFDWLFARYKRLKKILKTATLLGVCVGAFALAGTAAGSDILAKEKAARYVFQTDIRNAEADLRNRVRERVNAELVRASLPPPAPDHDCEKSAGPTGDCPKDPVTRLYVAHAEALRFADLWPEKPVSPDVPPEPGKASAFREAFDAISEIESFHGHPAPLARPIAVEDIPLRAIQAAAASLPPVDAADADTRKRLSDVVGLALSAVLEFEEIGIKLKLEKPLGKFVDSLGKSVTGSVQSKIEDAARDAMVRLMLACRGSGAQCAEGSKGTLKALQGKLASLGSTQKFSAALGALASRYSFDATRLARVNADADRWLRTAVDVQLSREGDGPWGDLRRRSAADFEESKGSGLTPMERIGWWRFFDAWKDAKKKIAARMVHGSQASSWDEAFLKWTAESADRAAIWSYIVLSDRTIRPYFVNTQPLWSGKHVDVVDTYKLFAATVRGQSLAPGVVIPESSLAHSKSFADAAHKYCPKNELSPFASSTRARWIRSRH